MTAEDFFDALNEYVHCVAAEAANGSEGGFETATRMARDELAAAVKALFMRLP